MHQKLLHARKEFSPTLKSSMKVPSFEKNDDIGYTKK